MTSWYDDYVNVIESSYSSFFDFKKDFSKSDKNYYHLLYDIVGIIGIIIIIISYILQLYYISLTKSIYGIPSIYFYLRFLGLALIILFAYLRKNVAAYAIVTTTIILVIIYSFTFRFFT